MEVFVKSLLEMSLTAAIVILVVIAARWLFALLRVPKRYACLLWILPFIRLVCPWSPESDFSLVPNTNQMMEAAFDWQEMTAGASVGSDAENQLGGTVPSDGNADRLAHTENSGGQNNAPANANKNETLPSVNYGGDKKDMTGADPAKTDGIHAVSPDGYSNANSGEKDDESAAANTKRVSDTQSMVWWTLFGIWLVGVFGIAVHSLISYGRLKKRLAVSWLLRDNIYLVDEIETAFVVGYRKPMIYLPSGIPEAETPYVIAHEQTHISRKDHWVKPLAFFITALHWFNPLCWLAFVLLGKDVEMSCDEAVIEKLGLENKKQYANVLLSMATEKMQFVGMPLAFAEGDPKNRIKNVMKYKKPAVVVLVLAAAAVLVLAVTLLTGPKNGNTGNNGTVLTSTEDNTQGGAGDGTADAIDYDVDNENNISHLLKYIQVLEEEKKKLSSEISHLQYEIDTINENMESMSMPHENYEMMQADLTEKQNIQTSKDVELEEVELQLKALKEKLAQIEEYNFNQMVKNPAPGAANPDDIPFGAVNITAPVVMIGMDGGWGADFVRLVYASPEYAVGYGHMGLFVYSVKEKKLTGAVNVKVLDCAHTQGDNYTDVFVADAGATVYLHPTEKDYMFAYHIFENTLEKLAFTDGGDGRPEGLEIDDISQDMMSVMGDKYADYWISSDCVICTVPESGKDKKYLCYLQSGSGVLKDLAYVVAEWNEEAQAWSESLEPGTNTWEPYNSEQYPFFEGDESQYLWEYTEDSQMYFAKAAGISATGLTLGIYNNSDREITCGAVYKLYAYNRGGDALEEVPYLDDIAYDDIAYTIEPQAVTTMTIDWSLVYGKLPVDAYPVRYRLVREIYVPKTELSDSTEGGGAESSKDGGSGAPYEKIELGVDFTFPAEEN